MYSVRVDRDQSRLEQLELSFLIVSVYDHLKLGSIDFYRFISYDLSFGRAHILRTFFNI